MKSKKKTEQNGRKRNFQVERQKAAITLPEHNYPKGAVYLSAQSEANSIG